MSDQQTAIDAINSGESVFLTGGAGVGKSHVIHQIVDNKTVLVAPTGIAALNIGGETCHSVFGLPFGMVTDEDRKKTPRNCNELFSGDQVSRLVIDEVSMCRADYFDLIDYRLRTARKNKLPFGGIQVVVVGDGFQLSPIVSYKESKFFRREYKSPYFFDSKVWKKAEFNPILLSKVYRQSDEQQIALLNEIRTKGKYWKQAVERLNEWCGIQEDPEQTTLCNYREDADRMNNHFYELNQEKERVYYGVVKDKYKENDCAVDMALKLKVGCKVILCANDVDKTYKNGQKGVILELKDKCVVVQLEDEDESVVQVIPHTWERIKYSKLMGSLTKIVEGSFTQFPLRLGWAITVHKAQGLTLDGCAVNLGRGSFANHQCYVALSRVKDLKNINLTRPILEDDILVDERVQKFYASLKT